MTNATPPTPAGSRRLRRPIEGRMLAGVAAGLADYFDVDVNLVRLVLVVLAVLGGSAIVLYVAAWLFIPEEGSEAPVAADLVHSFHR